jgi:hypothetical protein
MNSPRHSIKSQSIRRACPTTLCLLVLVVSSAAGAAEGDPSVTSGGEVLQARVQIPWYDADADALQPVTLQEPWRLDWLLDWLGALGWLAEPLTIAGIIVVVVVLLILGWYVFRTFRQRGGSTARVAKLDSLVATDRVEALPFLRQRSHHDLLGQARRHYEAGNYSEAIIYLFSHELVELDRCSLVRLAKGKTNRQYLREAKHAAPLAGLLERTMVTFEEAFFGQKTLDRAGFEVCWNQLGHFENLLVQSRQSP